MKQVIARKAGFYECLRREGDVFCVPDDLTASWFEALGQPDKQPEAEDKQPEAEDKQPEAEDKQPDKPKGKKDDDKPA